MRTRIVDAEVHVLPKIWCEPAFRPPPEETVMIEKFYDHLEGPVALPRASRLPTLKEMDRAGVDQALIMGLPWRSPKRCEENNDDIAECVVRHPDRFRGAGILPDPKQADPIAALDQIQRNGLIGVKIIPSWHEYRLNDTIMDGVYEEMVRRNLILIPHTDHCYLNPAESDTPYALFDVVTRHPKLKVLAPHLGGMLCLYSLHPPHKGIFDNVRFIASVPTTMKMISFAIASVGVDKVVFGSDSPFNPSHDQLRVVEDFLSCNLGERANVNILFKNISLFLENSL